MDNIINICDKLNKQDNSLIIYPIIKMNMEFLQENSQYDSSFDIDIYKKFEERFENKPPKGGIIYKNTFTYDKLNDRLYFNSYGRGCVHNCQSCVAMQELKAHGYWNKPFPMPVNITKIWYELYTTFELNKTTKYSDYLKSGKPVYLGYGSDSFMWMDLKYKITQEIIQLLNHYQIPYVIETKSDLVAHNTYTFILDRRYADIVILMSVSDDDNINREQEPGVPSRKRRQDAHDALTMLDFNVSCETRGSCIELK